MGTCSGLLFRSHSFHFQLGKDNVRRNQGQCSSLFWLNLHSVFFTGLRVALAVYGKPFPQGATSDIPSIWVTLESENVGSCEHRQSSSVWRAYLTCADSPWDLNFGQQFLFSIYSFLFYTSFILACGNVLCNSRLQTKQDYLWKHWTIKILHEGRNST